MPKLITFKAPAMDNGKYVQVEKKGFVVRLYVGNIQEKFVLQVSDLFPDEIECLTHYASGNKVGSLSHIKIRTMCGTGGRLTDKEAAKILINETVSRVGAERMLNTMNRAPVLNH